VNSSYLGLSLVAPNITNLVTVRLATPKDYLTWQTQFTIVLMGYLGPLMAPLLLLLLLYPARMVCNNPT